MGQDGILRPIVNRPPGTASGRPITNRPRDSIYKSELQTNSWVRLAHPSDVWWDTLLAIVMVTFLSAAAVRFVWQRGYTLYYGDAQCHVDCAARVGREHPALTGWGRHGCPCLIC